MTKTEKIHHLEIQRRQVQSTLDSISPKLSIYARYVETRKKIEQEIKELETA